MSSPTAPTKEDTFSWIKRNVWRAVLASGGICAVAAYWISQLPPHMQVEIRAAIAVFLALPIK